ncbi:MAG: AAA family ATPase [Chloroflexota bacterium]|nr:AAA family ATPase [Chloroflexota bacterium]
MITSLRLVNFKNFADETLRLGPFTLIVGANASGKSNIRDAFRFLEGICDNYTLAEILGGRYGAEDQPVRGAANEVIRFGQDEFALEVEMELTELLKSGVKSIRYFIRIRRDQAGGQFQVIAESLRTGARTPDSRVPEILYTSDPPLNCSKGAELEDSKLRLYLPLAGEPIEVASDQPGLSQIDDFLSDFVSMNGPEDIDDEQAKDLIAKLTIYLTKLDIRRELLSMHFLELSPESMRRAAVPGATRLGESGNNLATVLEAICGSAQRKSVLLSWLHELTPMDVEDLEFPIDLDGTVNLRIREANGRGVSAHSASDGTLRFLGMLAVLLSEDSAGFYFFEEIDNGIHPARLHLLLDLIERQTAKGKIQVVATTHSPDVLNLINDTTFENAVVVYRDEDAADAVIRQVA